MLKGGCILKTNRLKTKFIELAGYVLTIVVAASSFTGVVAASNEVHNAQGSVANANNSTTVSDSVYGKVYTSVYDSVYHSVYDSVYDSVYHSVYDSVYTHTNGGSGSGSGGGSGSSSSSSTATTTTTVTTQSTPESAEVVLTDIKGHWAEANIKELVVTGAIYGYPDQTFKPDRTITRAEFATVLVKALKLTPKSGSIFIDSVDHWAKDYISTAEENGIITGYGDGKFGPDDLITREQMAIMIVRSAKLTDTEDNTPFTDGQNISKWAVNAVAAAVKNEIIKGYTDNTFKPKNNATRAEAVTVIVKALKVIKN